MRNSASANRPATKNLAAIHFAAMLAAMPRQPEQLLLPLGEPADRPRNPARPETRQASIVDFEKARARLRPRIESRRDVVGALVGQLAALVRGTTTPDQASEVRKAATRALDLFERADRGEGRERDLDAALRKVEAVLRAQRN